MALNVSLSVSMPPELVDDLDQLREQDESRSAVVRRLIRQETGEIDNQSEVTGNEQEADA